MRMQWNKQIVGARQDWWDCVRTQERITFWLPSAVGRLICLSSVYCSCSCLKPDRAATSDYFHCRLICLFTFSINRLVAWTQWHHNLNPFSLMSERSKEARKQSDLGSWNQRIFTFFPSQFPKSINQFCSKTCHEYTCLKVQYVRIGQLQFLHPINSGWVTAD